MCFKCQVCFKIWASIISLSQNTFRYTVLPEYRCQAQVLDVLGLSAVQVGKDSVIFSMWDKSSDHQKCYCVSSFAFWGRRVGVDTKWLSLVCPLKSRTGILRSLRRDLAQTSSLCATFIPNMWIREEQHLFGNSTYILVPHLLLSQNCGQPSLLFLQLSDSPYSPEYFSWMEPRNMNTRLSVKREESQERVVVISLKRFHDNIWLQNGQTRGTDV